jgi:hypothetical protein
MLVHPESPIDSQPINAKSFATNYYDYVILIVDAPSVTSGDYRMLNCICFLKLLKASANGSAFNSSNDGNRF